MKLPFKQQVVIEGQVVLETVRHHTVGERRSVAIFTPNLEHKRALRQFVDLGNGWGAWSTVGVD